MAEDLDDGEFWLPSQFLTEEDILTDFDTSTPSTNSTNGFNSDLGSPVESVTETESDEDEFLAELTGQMARSSLLQDCVTTSPKGWMFSGSPQSTLCSVGGVRVRGGNGDGSSRGSPTGPVSSPPASAKGDCFKGSDAAAFDLLHAAADEVAKMGVRNEQQQQGTGYFDRSRELLCPPRMQTSPVCLPHLKVYANSPNLSRFSSHQSREQLQAFQFQQLCSQEMMKQQPNKGGIWGQVKPYEQMISRAINGEEFFPGGRSNHLHDRRLGLSPSVWQPLQHPANRQLHPPVSTQNLPVSGMRTAFLGTPVSKRESVGTGVFLPRRVNPSESRKSSSNKSACSTVLLPEKVVQALNNTTQSHCQPRLDSTGRSRGRNNGFHPTRRNNDNPRSQAGTNANLEIRLPSEWTY